MTKRRWLKSAIATSAQAQPALPFQRAMRNKLTLLKPAPSAQIRRSLQDAR